jgi:acetylornithine deacetylase/succinyl-diaminopimelate desuccinylase-like protein
VVRLANALARLAAWTPPARLNDTTWTYFERLAAISTPEAAARYQSLFDPARRPAAEQYLAQHELRHSAMLRTSIVPTILKAGFRGNVIPSEAEAYLDVRALPDEDMEQFMAQMRAIIGDPHVELVKGQSWRAAAPPSRLDSDMFRALEAAQARVYPGAAVIPTMTTGATDMAPLRARGVQAYGIGPLVEQAERRQGGGAHGDDEHILERALHDFVRFQWYAVLEVAAAK